MTTYTKEQLMLVSVEVLQALAQQFDTPHKNSNEKDLLVADILNAQQNQLSEDAPLVPAKRKRGRPSKAEVAAREAAEAMAKAIQGQECCEQGSNSEPKAEPESKEKPKGKMHEVIVKSYKKVDDNFIIVEDLPRMERIELTKGGVNITANVEPTTKPANRRNFERPQAVPTRQHAAPGVPEMLLLEGGGVLELTKENYGFLRSADYNYLTSPDDIYVSPMQLRQYGLKPGDVVTGKIRVPRDDDKFFVLHSVDTINGLSPIEVRNRVAFEHLTPLFPDEKFNLCRGTKDSLSRRVVDVFAPIGKGQRALIVAQPKTGKTMLMKEIANAIAENHPDTYLMMLLIDERPEEVTDMKRTVKAEVIASTFDAPASNHVKIAGIVLEKAKRMVECGHDVVIFLDSITRLARAYNTEAPASGKILSGGVDANSLQRPKRFFGAARNIEGGGSLTIIATALIDTGSRMDEVIFEEFKGTGNMELQLDRQLANKRIFPAVNVMASSTRRDDLLLPPTTCNRMWVLRNYLSQLNTVEAMQEVIKQMDNTLNNEEMLMTMGDFK